MEDDAAGVYGHDAPFWEASELLRYTPERPDAELGNYVHHYEQAGYEGQLLSGQMRELIATLMLVVVGHQRFAARHVRRLYRMGVTSQVIVDVFWAASSFIGRAHVLSAVRTVHLANDASNQEGTMPPGGPPTELTDFPELHLGNRGGGKQSLVNKPEWQLVAKIEPRLATLCLEFYDRVMGDSHSWTLPVGARELIAVVCLSYRGMHDLAADHIREAFASGATAQHVLEALSAAIPMTGLATLQTGAKALLLAQAPDRG